MIKRAIVADFGRLTDDDPHAVVDEHAAADRGAGVDLDPREESPAMGQPAGKPAPAMAPQPVRHEAMPDERMQPGVARQHFPLAARRRIPVEHHGDVFTKAIEHDGIFAFPTGMLNYCGAPRLDQAQIKRAASRSAARVTDFRARFQRSRTDAMIRPAVANPNRME